MAVVGADIVNNVLGAGDPLGKEIRVDGEPYTVIGVGEAKGNPFGQSQDNWVAIPLSAYLHRYGSNSSLSIYVDTGGGGEVMESVSDELRTIMRIRRHLVREADTFNSIPAPLSRTCWARSARELRSVVAAMPPSLWLWGELSS